MNKTALNELKSRLKNHDYEESESGLFLPRANLMLGGVFGLAVNDEEPQLFPNLIVNQFRTLALEILFNSGSVPANYYLIPYATATDPQPTWTAGNFTANAGEFRNIDESARQLWVVGSVTSYAIGNSASPAVFTVADGATYNQFTIEGAGLLTASGLGVTTGTLVAASRAASPRTGLVDGDTVSVTYTIQLNDAS